MTQALFPEPKPDQFDVKSDYWYSLSFWHEQEDELHLAALAMQRARYWQEVEYAEAIQDRQLKKRTRFTNSPRSENPEIRRREDATAVAKVFYMRSRTRSPFIEEMPDWDELTQGSRDYMINDAKEAIRVLDARRNAGKVNS